MDVVGSERPTVAEVIEYQNSAVEATLGMVASASTEAKSTVNQSLFRKNLHLSYLIISEVL